MEWVETTAKTVEEARDAALDRLGVAADDAEFDVLEEPRPGLFGRVRGEARVRARVRPAEVRPKQERRRRSRGERTGGRRGQSDETSASPDSAASATTTDEDAGGIEATTTDAAADAPTGDSVPSAAPMSSGNGKRRSGGSNRAETSTTEQERSMNDDDQTEPTVSPDEVGAAAVAFMDGLTAAFGQETTSTLDVDGLELDVRVDGRELGLLIGPAGRTLNAIQDLARVAAQRRLGDHDTRLRIDVAGYRERRQEALARFASEVAETVRTTGSARSLEPMSSSDRKVIHDVLNEESGVTSRSEGEDPTRRIVVEPA